MRSSKLVNEAALRAALDRDRLDGLIAVSPKNVFYYSGSPVARTKLFDCLPQEPGRATLSAVLVPLNGENTLICPEREETVNREGAWVERLELYEPYRQSPMEAVAKAVRDQGIEGGRLGIEAGYLTVGYLGSLAELLPRAQLVPSDERFEWIRSLKTPGELQTLKETGDLLDDVFLEVFSSARIGDTEWDLHCRVMESALRRGAEYCRGMMVVGANNDIDFFGTNFKPLEPGDIVHTDYATYLRGYPSNLSRLAVVGEPSNRQRKKYANLLAVERRIVEFMRPGVTGKEVFWFGRQACHDLGYIHTACILGHNLGLGYHDRPMLTPAETMPLEPNNVIALEPLLEWAFHIQDQVVVTEDGAYIQSDKFDTRELFVIE